MKMNKRVHILLGFLFIFFNFLFYVYHESFVSTQLNQIHQLVRSSLLKGDNSTVVDILENLKPQWIDEYEIEYPSLLNTTSQSRVGHRLNIYYGQSGEDLCATIYIDFNLKLFWIIASVSNFILAFIIFLFSFVLDESLKRIILERERVLSDFIKHLAVILKYKDFAIIEHLASFQENEIIKSNYNTFIEHLNDFVSSEKSRAVSSVAEHVAHDLRSPLAALNTMLSNSTYAHFSDEGVRKVVLNSLSRIKKICEDLLEVKREESKYDKVNLCNLVSEIMEEKQATLQDKNIQLKNKISTQSELNIYAESAGLKRIISNLLENSIEAFNSESGKVEVLSEQSRDGFFEIKIQDNGPGIPQELLPRLFQKGSSFGKKRGNGLGLFAAREYVRKAGGDIFIESVVGTGTCVTLNFPMKRGCI